MKYLYLLIFITSCTPTYLVTKQEFNEIPKGSKKVIAEVKYSPDSLFTNIAKIMAKDGWPLQSDRPSMSMSSTGKSIGSGTFLKPAIYIESTASGSKAYFSGQWGLDANGQIVMQSFTNSSNYGFTEIVFGKTGTSKADVSFQKLLQLAEQLQGVQITFSK